MFCQRIDRSVRNINTPFKKGISLIFHAKVASQAVFSERPLDKTKWGGGTIRYI